MGSRIFPGLRDVAKAMDLEAYIGIELYTHRAGMHVCSGHRYDWLLQHTFDIDSTHKRYTERVKRQQHIEFDWRISQHNSCKG